MLLVLINSSDGNVFRIRVDMGFPEIYAAVDEKQASEFAYRKLDEM